MGQSTRARAPGARARSGGIAMRPGDNLELTSSFLGILPSPTSCTSETRLVQVKFPKTSGQSKPTRASAECLRARHLRHGDGRGDLHHIPSCARLPERDLASLDNLLVPRPTLQPSPRH